MLTKRATNSDNVPSRPTKKIGGAIAATIPKGSRMPVLVGRALRPKRTPKAVVASQPEVRKARKGIPAAKNAAGT